MGLLKKYDPKKVFINWDGLELNAGIAEGTFITATRTARNASLNVGSDGGTTMVIINDQSGTIELTLRRGSDVNDALTVKLRQDEAAGEIKNVGALRINDFNGNSEITDTEAFLDGPPTMEYATEESNQTWTFMCPFLDLTPGGSNAAITTAP